MRLAIRTLRYGEFLLNDDMYTKLLKLRQKYFGKRYRPQARVTHLEVQLLESHLSSTIFFIRVLTVEVPGEK